MRNLTRRIVCARSMPAICVAAIAIGTSVTTSGLAAMPRDFHIIYVDAEAGDDGDGTEWATPFKHL